VRNSRSKLSTGRIEQGFQSSKLPYSDGQARGEAQRCLYCHDAPCTKACPAGVDVPGFIRKITTGNIKGAARTIFRANVLGYSCGCVCPVEALCVGACLLKLAPAPPVEIGRLQRYATERFVGTPAGAYLLLATGVKRTGRKVALVGAGPASLACASHLVSCGHEAVIFEKRDLPGGLNLYGIAPDKLHADDALREAEWVLASGVELRTGVEVGKDVSCERLLEEYDAVFLGVGLGRDSRLGIPGEDGPGVHGAVETIEKLKLDPAFRLEGLFRASSSTCGPGGAAEAMQICDMAGAVVIGGGNTATDIARELACLGVRGVTILYRRTEKERPGYAHELRAARLAGVRFVENTVPVRVLRERGDAAVGDGRGAVGMAGDAGRESGGTVAEKVGPLKGLLVANAEKAKPVAGTECEFPARAVFVAIGQAGMPELLSRLPGVESDSSGCVRIDEKTGRTGNPRIFAGGDCVNGGREVVNAVAEGKRAALAIDEMLR